MKALTFNQENMLRSVFSLSENNIAPESGRGNTTFFGMDILEFRNGDFQYAWKIVRVKDGFGIEIPEEIMKECGLGFHDAVNLEVRDGNLVISLYYKHKSLEERTAEYGGFGDLSEVNWGAPQGREVL